MWKQTIFKHYVLIFLKCINYLNDDNIFKIPIKNNLKNKIFDFNIVSGNVKKYI